MYMLKQYFFIQLQKTNAEIIYSLDNVAMWPIQHVCYLIESKVY